MSLHPFMSFLIILQVVIDLLLVVFLVFFYLRLRTIEPERISQLIEELKAHRDAISPGSKNTDPFSHSAASEIEKVFELAKSGASIEEISEVTGLSPKEVNTALKLKRGS